jgi:hypothetical protein
MSQRRNWSAVAGLVLGLAGIVAYFSLIQIQDAALHRFLDMPILNIAAFAVGLYLSLAGIRQARQGTHRGRVLAPVLAVLNFGLAGLFGWFLFVYTSRMPAAAHAPAVGAPAPDFALQDERGNGVRLSALRGHPVVLLFYRGYW